VSAAGNPWLLSGSASTGTPGAAATPSLICLPHLGGNAAVFGWFAARLAPEVRVLPVQLPGHGSRSGERALTSIDEIADALILGLREELRGPTVLYGHSFGALVAFELARRLVAGLGHPPAHLVVGACRAPDAPLDRPQLHGSPDADVLDYLRSMDGTPPSLVDDADLRALVLPSVRADLEAWETYRFVPAAPLSMPITALAGRADRSVEAAELRGWAPHTGGGFGLRTVEGGHFFLRDARTEVAAILRELTLGAVTERAVPA
jgi:surfactin synthase thioesterase subunit